MKIFVIDFSKDKTLIEICAKKGAIIEFEQNDGALAYQKSRKFMPDIIVVNYLDKPSHGRLTAQKIKQRKMTSNIPIYFIDGLESENEKIRNIGTPITLKQFIELRLS